MMSLITRQFLFFVIAVLAILTTTGCGKRGAPIPPRERVPQTVEITGYQQGSEIFLTWKMPARNAASRSVQNIARADVYRLVEPADSFTVLTEAEFADRSTIVSTVDFVAGDFAAKTFTIADEVGFSDRPLLIRYAVRLVNGMGQKAGFSNFLSIEPSADVAKAPGALSAEASQAAVLLTWSQPLENLDGGSPDNLKGYNVYRKDGEAAFKRINTEVVESTVFEDETFEFGKSYTYFLRAVSATASGATVESSDTAKVEISPIDIFPPEPPEAVTIAASLTEISVFFASNLENDIAGYIVYRSTDRDIPLEDWDRLNQELLTTNTFRDEQVEGGKTYYYYVVAVDERGNRSKASELVGDTVPTR
jgi:hypothetical protein